jgi:hypothetical protein
MIEFLRGLFTALSRAEIEGFPDDEVGEMRRSLLSITAVDTARGEGAERSGLYFVS